MMIMTMPEMRKVYDEYVNGQGHVFNDSDDDSEENDFMTKGSKVLEMLFYDSIPCLCIMLTSIDRLALLLVPSRWDTAPMITP